MYTKRFVVKARCEDGKVRTAVQTGEPTTFWTTPARVQAHGKTVSGFIAHDSAAEEWYFCADHSGKNAATIKDLEFGVTAENEVTNNG